MEASLLATSLAMSTQDILLLILPVLGSINPPQAAYNMGDPGLTSWTRVIEAKFSAFETTAVPLRVIGDVAPANGMGPRVIGIPALEKTIMLSLASVKDKGEAVSE